MANYIKVDHSKFEVTANVFDNYVKKHKENMGKATQEVTMMSSAWEGRDFMQFKNRWDKIDDKGSKSQKMIESMENYADFLRYAAGKYKQAQSNALNRANSISRW